jgi:hypothetical protein
MVNGRTMFGSLAVGVFIASAMGLFIFLYVDSIECHGPRKSQGVPVLISADKLTADTTVGIQNLTRTHVPKEYLSPGFIRADAIKSINGARLKSDIEDGQYLEVNDFYIETVGSEVLLDEGEVSISVPLHSVRYPNQIDEKGDRADIAVSTAPNLETGPEYLERETGRDADEAREYMLIEEAHFLGVTSQNLRLAVDKQQRRKVKQVRKKGGRLIAYPANISRNKPDNVEVPILPDQVTLRDATDKLAPLAKSRVARSPNRENCPRTLSYLPDCPE